MKDDRNNSNNSANKQPYYSYYKQILMYDNKLMFSFLFLSSLSLNCFVCLLSHVVVVVVVVILLLLLLVELVSSTFTFTFTLCIQTQRDNGLGSSQLSQSLQLLCLHP